MDPREYAQTLDAKLGTESFSPRDINARIVAETLRAFASCTRLQAALTLTRFPEGLTRCQMQEKLHLGNGIESHVALLNKAGVIEREGFGRKMKYTFVDSDALYETTSVLRHVARRTTSIATEPQQANETFEPISINDGASLGAAKRLFDELSVETRIRIILLLAQGNKTDEVIACSVLQKPVSSLSAHFRGLNKGGIEIVTGDETDYGTMMSLGQSDAPNIGYRALGTLILAASGDLSNELTRKTEPAVLDAAGGQADRPLSMAPSPSAA